MEISPLFMCLLTGALLLDHTGMMVVSCAGMIIHEGGHLLAMGLTARMPSRFSLLPGSIQMETHGAPPNKDLARIAAAGPLANTLAAVAILPGFWLGSLNLLRFGMVNLCLAGFNLLPVSGLDGGDLLRWFLFRHHSPAATDALCHLAAAASLLLLLAGGCFFLWRAHNLTLIIAAIDLAILFFMGIKTKPT